MLEKETNLILLNFTRNDNICLLSVVKKWPLVSVSMKYFYNYQVVLDVVKL